jgi:Ca2+-binding RTX toxin-like protein
MSAKDFAKLQSLSYEIADLPEGQLATLKGNQITLDTTAAGHGWFFDNSPNGDNEFDVPVPNQELQTTEYSAAHGRVDLLTVLMREIGSTLTFSKSQLVGPLNWLMENTLEPGTRRAPAFKLGEVGKLSVPKARDSQRVAAKSSGEQQLNSANAQLVASNKPRNSRNVSRHHANATRSTPMSFVDVLLNIGTLPAGKSVTIKFDVTVDNPYLGATNQVSNQGTVSGANFANKLTDDPDFGGAADPTLTTIDQPDVSVAVSPASVLEDGAGNLVYTFTREGSTAAALTVNFSVGGTATFNTDYTQTGAATFNATSGTVVIPVGSSTATVTLDPTTDTTVEPNETAILTVIAGTSYDIGAPAAATGTITNDDTDVTVAVAPSSVEEDGAPNLVYTFTRNGVTTGPLTVNFSVGGTATFNNDYTQTGAATFTATDGTVTFAAGNTTTTVTVDPTTDNTVEPSETVILTLTTGTGYNVANPSTATGTINNDDAEVTVAVAPSAVDEDGAANLVYTFTRTGDTTGALTVNFSVGGTATFSTDYTQTGAATFTATTGTVTFADGNSTAAVTVDPSADITAEPDETVILTLTAGTGYNIGTPGAATGTINNDDTSVSVAVSPLATDEDGATNLVYTFTRSDSSGALTVNFSIGGTATFNTDYTQTGAATFTPPTGTVTFADGSLTATVTVDPSSDLGVEPDETVILTVTAGAGYTVGAPASATGTITNDDTDVSVAVAPLSTTEDGAGNLVYTFTRSGVTTGALTVNFLVSGTATFNTDYTQTGADSFVPPNGTVTFAAGSSTATVTVDPTADNSVEPDETVILTVTNGTGYNVGAPSVATGTITNDDSSVSVAVAPLTVDEDGVSNLVYTFTRSGSTTAALTVNFTVGGTADSANDYTQTGAATFTPPTGTVTFAAGSSTATVTIDPTADGTTEPDETVILTVVAGTGYEVGAPDSATGTINNDDNAVSVAVSPLTTNEDGTTNLVYTFTRGDSSGAQTINFSVGGTATFNTDYTQTGAATFTASSGTVSFADGSLTATVTVDPSADITVEPDETVTLTVTAGAGYTVGAPALATGTITNDDTNVSVAVSPLSTTEDGAGNLVYTFTRTGVTSGPLTVNFSVGGTASSSTDYTQSGAASFTPPTGTVTFLAGSSTATVTVDPTADGAAELDETVILTVTAGTGYNVVAPSVATGTITNDDTEVSVAVSPSSVLEDGAANLVFTFTRVGITSGALTVNFQASGTAVFAPPGGDYTQFGADTFTNGGPGTVTFLAGSSTATVTADPFGDALLEPNETVILTVTAGAGYTVGTPNSATGTILNDDNSPPTIQVGYGQCNAETTGTVNLLVGDVETPANSLTLSATSSNTSVVALSDITFGGSGANRTLKVKAKMQASVAFSDLTITVNDGTFTSSINVRVIVGTNKTEVINIGTTTVGTDMIFGGNGDDTINSGAGNDLICGGNGGGTINAGLGNDTVDGGNGNDTLIGGDGDDRLIGGNGNDTMTGGIGADFFDGGGGTDTVTDFNPGQGDTKTGVEIGLLFGPTDWNERGVLAYFAPPPRYWISPWGTLHY